MFYPSNAKIEDRAIGALKNIIDDDLTMAAQFNSMDKEMAWDGYIYIYKKNNGDQSKKNLDDKVPVQIKGHIDKESKYLNRKRITFSVNLVDLEIYHDDRGVVYFEIFMSEDGTRREIFYSLLYPSKIKGYLEKAAQKGNNTSISIGFNKLVKSPQKLYIVVKQFSQESKRQGFGSGEIVQNTIAIQDLDKVTSMTATAIGAKNEFEFMQRLSTGDVCFYGTTKENQIKVPIAWDEDNRHYLEKQVNKSVSINGKIYYETYRIIWSSTGDFTMVLSENLQIELEKKKFQIIRRTGIKEFGKDAHFILELINNKSFKIGNAIVSYHGFNIPDSLVGELKFMDDLNNTLNEIEFDYDKPFWNLPLDVKKQLIQIVAIRNGEMNNILTDRVSFFDWKIEDKYMPVIIIKQDDGSVELNNGVFSKNQISVKNDKEEHYIIPLFGYADQKILANLYYYNYELFYEQIDSADVNVYTLDFLNHTALKLIQAYDINGNEKLLDIAEYQLKKIEKFEKEKIYFILNMLQITKRRGLFSDRESIILQGLYTNNLQELFGINVLLENKEKAKKIYDQMEQEEQDLIAEYPIYFLYQNL